VPANNDFLGAPSPPEPTHFPYTTLFRSTTIKDSSGGAVTSVLGESVYDTSTVTGQVGDFAIGTVSYTFNGDPAGSGAQSTTKGRPQAHTSELKSLADRVCDHLRATRADE